MEEPGIVGWTRQPGSELKREQKMKSWITMAALTATLMGGAMAVSAPASAQVHIGIGVPGVHVGVGVGAPAFYYGQGFYPPGPCDGYNSYYEGDCGYSVYNGPVILGGISVGGPALLSLVQWPAHVLVSRQLADMAWMGSLQLRLGSWRRLWLARWPFRSRLGQCPLAWSSGGFPWRPRSWPRQRP